MSGLFKPTKIKADIVIYSKWCVPCLYPEEMLAINYYASEHDLTVQLVRTVYRPADHKRAMELWRCREGVPPHELEEAIENYPTFVVYKKITRLEDFIKMIKAEQLKDKQVKADDLQRLSKTKGAVGENRLDGPIPETPTENTEHR